MAFRCDRMADFKKDLKLSLLKMKLLTILLFLGLALPAFSQKDSLGMVTGTVLDEKSRPLEGANLRLALLADSTQGRTIQTNKDGAFSFERMPFGYYRLRISFVGRKAVSLDSLFLRAERYDFNLNDITLSPVTDQNMEEVIIYAEKPLIQSKDGNITFNAGESALAAGSNASELLTNVPLVTKDPNGKILVRGKEPKILIDDKPVELNLQQLQDLLESMPGSSVEKIEVLTNPPPQYANEQGGVINIVTRKGTVGTNGRLTVSGGTRGEAGINGNFSYRKQGLSLSVNAGGGYNDFQNEGYSRRQNIYKDSVSYFNTDNVGNNRSWRPNFRANLNYDLNKFHGFTATFQYNQSNADNGNATRYINLNRLEEIYRLRNRDIIGQGDSYNPSVNFSYTLKTKRPGETLRFFWTYSYSLSKNARDFYEQYLNGDGTPTGRDSTQQQLTDNRSNNWSYRLSYDLPLSNKKTFLSLGGYYSINRSDINIRAAYLPKGLPDWVTIEPLTNHFVFAQHLVNYRFSVRQVLGENFSATAGLAAEQTEISFDLLKLGTDSGNRYWSYLPFANLNKNWKDLLNLTLSYRRTIRRPGINELNPTVDISDPYNIRSGNLYLLPSLAHNFDLVLGKTKPKFYINLGLGYNIVEDIFSSIRTRISNDTTLITWQNISGRKEYEASTWSGFTLSKKVKLNFSASYIFNEYSDYDIQERKFRNGGSLTANLNGTYLWSDFFNINSTFTYNQFANPQGSVSSTVSMNLGFQGKLLQKKLIVTLNLVDPFVQQQNRTVTYGTNFTLENSSLTQTRNFRLSVGYVFNRSQKARPRATSEAIRKAVGTKQ